MMYEPKPTMRERGISPRVAVASIAIAVLAGFLVGVALGAAGYWWYSEGHDTEVDAVEEVGADVGVVEVKEDFNPDQRRFAARMNAAAMIGDPVEQSAALAALARDAAEEDQGETAVRALQQIRHSQERDDAAPAVIRALLEERQTEAALEAAQLIQEPKARNTALRAVAEGKWPESSVEDAVEIIEEESD